MGLEVSQEPKQLLENAQTSGAMPEYRTRVQGGFLGWRAKVV